MLNWHLSSRTIHFGIVTADPHFARWDNDALVSIEKMIRYDFEFDGYAVSIKRISQDTNMSCTEEFKWRLAIRSKLQARRAQITSVVPTQSTTT